jgi:hypothetical protein
MEETNNQTNKRETVSKALVVCFIDRCINLPVSKTKMKNYFCYSILIL